MDKYLFGQSISRTFFALQDNEPLNIPSQAPALYLFNDRPTFEAASLGTDAVQTLNYWGHDTTTPFPRSYTWEPVANPSPNGGVYIKRYWEGVNWYNDLAQQIQTIIRPLELEAAEELDSIPGTSIDDIKSAYPAISSYLTDAQLTFQLTTAIDEFKLDLEARGYQYHQLYNLKKARIALAYLAIANASFTQFQNIDDKFYVRWEKYNAKYSALMAKMNFEVDVDGDNEPDGNAETGSRFIISVR